MFQKRFCCQNSLTRWHFNVFWFLKVLSLCIRNSIELNILSFDLWKFKIFPFFCLDCLNLWFFSKCKYNGTLKTLNLDEVIKITLEGQWKSLNGITENIINQFMWSLWQRPIYTLLSNKGMRLTWMLLSLR